MLEPRFWPRFIISNSLFSFQIIYRSLVNTHLHFNILQNFENFEAVLTSHDVVEQCLIFLWKWFKVIQNYQKVKWSKDWTDFVPKSRSLNRSRNDFDDPNSKNLPTFKTLSNVIVVLTDRNGPELLSTILCISKAFNLVLSTKTGKCRSSTSRSTKVVLTQTVVTNQSKIEVWNSIGPY